MTSNKQKLIEMRNLLNEPNHWTQGAYARDIYGVSEFPTSNAAACWCLRGALIKTNSLATDCETVLNDEIRNSYYRFHEMVEFNDFPGTKHADVLDLLDRVIAHAE